MLQFLKSTENYYKVSFEIAIFLTLMGVPWILKKLIPLLLFMYGSTRNTPVNLLDGFSF